MGNARHCGHTRLRTVARNHLKLSLWLVVSLVIHSVVLKIITLLLASQSLLHKGTSLGYFTGSLVTFHLPRLMPKGRRRKMIHAKWIMHACIHAWWIMNYARFMHSRSTVAPRVKRGKKEKGKKNSGGKSISSLIPDKSYSQVKDQNFRIHP